MIIRPKKEHCLILYTNLHPYIHILTRTLTPMYIVYTHSATHKDICTCNCKTKAGYIK